MAISKKRTTTTVVEEYARDASTPLGATGAGIQSPDSGAIGADSTLGQPQLDAPVEGQTLPSSSQKTKTPAEHGDFGQLAQAFLSKHIGKILFGVVQLGVLLVIGAWYVSKFDSALTQARDELKSLGTKVDRISEDVIKQGVRLEGVEQAARKTISTLPVVPAAPASSGAARPGS